MSIFKMKRQYYIVQDSIRIQGVKIFLKNTEKARQDRDWWTLDINEAEVFESGREAETLIYKRNYKLNNTKAVDKTRALQIIKENDEILNQKSNNLTEELIYLES